MNEADARAEAKRRGAEDDAHEFLARQTDDGEWTVVKVSLPDGMRKAHGDATSSEPPPVPPAGPDSNDRARRTWGVG